MNGSIFSPLSSLASVARDHPLNRGRVGWWLATPGRMGGTVLQDLLGRFPASIPNGATWTGAFPRAGIALDGVSQYAQANAASLPHFPAFTVGVRFVPTAAMIPSGGLHGLFVRQANPGDSDRCCRLQWEPSGGGSGVFRTDSRSAFSYSGNGLVTAGVETFVALSVDASGTNAAFYQDGVKLTAGPGIYLAPANDAGGLPFVIGCNVLNSLNTPATFLEAYVYDRVLSGGEIVMLHDQQRRGHPDLLRRAANFKTFSLGASFQAGLVGRQAALGVGIY